MGGAVTLDDADGRHSSQAVAATRLLRRAAIEAGGDSGLMGLQSFLGAA